ncbi:MAG: hypothetical protein K0U24_06115 [Gammaproteobacteria bacterium]|nr:hypothetical protein [Gammaproteobacteria bacterium]MCH9717836.1 hypothetical protein [Gammaproteobacteria bacterium]MCH9763779.1 hypothetical protein [Gammaproteobacteria bacterium]
MPSFHSTFNSNRLSEITKAFVDNPANNYGCLFEIAKRRGVVDAVSGQFNQEVDAWGRHETEAEKKSLLETWHTKQGREDQAQFTQNTADTQKDNQTAVRYQQEIAGITRQLATLPAASDEVRSSGGSGPQEGEGTHTFLEKKLADLRLEEQVFLQQKSACDAARGQSGADMMSRMMFRSTAGDAALSADNKVLFQRELETKIADIHQEAQRLKSSAGTASYECFAQEIKTQLANQHSALSAKTRPFEREVFSDLMQRIDMYQAKQRACGESRIRLASSTQQLNAAQSKVADWGKDLRAAGQYNPDFRIANEQLKKNRDAEAVLKNIWAGYSMALGAIAGLGAIVLTGALVFSWPVLVAVTAGIVTGLGLAALGFSYYNYSSASTAQVGHLSALEKELLVLDDAINQYERVRPEASVLPSSIFSAQPSSQPIVEAVLLDDKALNDEGAIYAR